MAQKMKSSIHLCVIDHKKKVSNVTESQNAHDQKPDHCMDLKGARVAWCTGGKSKRSHVFEVTQTVLSLTMLLQDDSLQVAAEWFEEVRYLVLGLFTYLTVSGHLFLGIKLFFPQLNLKFR